MLVVTGTVTPHIPHEHRINKLGKLAHVTLKVEYLSVVERSRNAHSAQQRRITLEVLYCVSVGVKHIRVLAYRARSLACALQQVVVVGINASNHVSSQRIAKYVCYGHFLAFCQRCARRQHYFEIQLVVLETCKHVAPEHHVVISFNVCHYAPSGSRRFHTRSRPDIV